MRLKIVHAGLALIGILIGTLLLRTFFASSPLNIPPPEHPLPLLDPPEESLLRLQRFLSFPTISPQNPQEFQPGPFLKAHSFLEQEYPRIHKKLIREVINEYSLLYTWKGTNPQAPPLILMGHLDVVPIPPETLSLWRFPPFSGTLAEGFIWGRGALDDKGSVLAILEAVEALLGEGYKPARTIYLAFGHDEEIGGSRGARSIAELLSSRGVKPFLVLDEGLAVLEGIFTGVTQPIALIGVGEKGYMSVELTVATAGGHSSMPGPENSIVILSRALMRLNAHPFRSRITPVMETLLETLAPETGFKERLVLTNLWLFDPLVRFRLAKNPGLNATIRTTMAPTIFQAGIKENLLPPYARAVVNLRILPGDDPSKLLARMKRIVGDPRVHIQELSGLKSDPSPLARWDTSAFARIAQVVKVIYPEALISPGLVVGATDSRHFLSLTSEIYRFSPFLLSSNDLKGIHGLNERISIAGYKKAIQFYAALVKALGSHP